MRHECFLLAAFAASLLAVPAEGGSADGSPRKRHVAFGWEFEVATPSNVLKVVDALDRTPVDGVGLCPRLIDRRGRPIKSKMMDQPALEWEDLEPWVPVLRELASHRSMRESMMRSICAPTNRLDWTDDAAWRRVSTTMRQLARLAREGGLRGLWVDDEDYHRQRQYYWRAGDPPYDRLCEIARARGREVFSSMFAEYPDMTLFFFRFFSRVHAYHNYEDLASARRAKGDLWPAFLNGLLDVLPPKAKIVDGYEYGYRFDSQKREYYFGYALQKSRYAGHAEPSNRAKYVTQVSSASAIYLDRYVNPETSRWYAAPLNGSRTARFAADVAQATHVSDDYVWFWGERHGWTGGKRKTWEEVLPGMSDAMRLARDSRGFAAERLALLKRTGRYAPLNANVECRQAAGSADGCLSKPYSGWSDTAVGDAGRFGFDSAVGENDGSSLVAEGVAGGCLVMTSKPVVPGKAYIVGFSAKGDLVGGSVEWQRDGKWDFSIPGLSVPLSAPDANGWRHGITAIRIPENANGFGLQLQVRQAPGERSWFDNVFYCDAE
jgi:hypothetical protein